MSLAITGSGNSMAMDGLKVQNYQNSQNPIKTSYEPVKVNNAAAETVDEITKNETNVENIQKQVQQLQSISDLIGRKIQFKVNEELGDVVVKIVDPTTDKVIKEIPSTDIQRLQVRIREALGLLMDEMI